MRQIRIITLLLLSGVIFTLGCNPRETTIQLAKSTAGLFELNTKVNQFVEMPSGDPMEAEFGGYDISLVMQAVKPGDLNGIDSFRITIDTRYIEKVDDKKAAMKTPALELDSLTITIMRNDSVFQPPVFADNFVERKDNPFIQHKKLFGPSYRYDLVRIPGASGTIQVSFVAETVDRKTGSVIERGRIERTLEGVSELKYFQLY